MANLTKKNGIYLARFRYRGKEYKRSLHTSDATDAKTAMIEIERALHRLAIHMLPMPEGVDPGDFIVSGGTLQPAEIKPPRPATPSLAAAAKEYLLRLEHLAPSHRSTIGVHLNNLQKHLPRQSEQPLDQITFAELDGFQQARLKQRANTTVAKERQTILAFFEWAEAMQYVAKSPARGLAPVAESAEKDRFQTLEQIEAKLARGGLDDEQRQACWDCLYLTQGQIAELLGLVRSRSRYDVSYLLHAIPAYTGMRRGEVLRLRWSDVDFDRDNLVARSTKQSRQRTETQRDIDLHPELKQMLLAWRSKRPRGQHLMCDPGCVAPLTPRLANTRFWQPLRGTTWCLDSRKKSFKIGFHTYRHSFASNLAALGVDQRIIDAWMGHQTEAMRKRYRHLFPQQRRMAIESFSLQAAAAPLG